MTKAERYVRLRLNGVGSKHAARVVGFAGGRPSGHAHRLWRNVELLRANREACKWVRASKLRLEAQLRTVREKERACRLLESIQPQESTDA